MLKRNVLSGIAVFVLLMACSWLPAQASTLTVTNGNDTGGGSLREAIAIANGNADASEITFSTLFNSAQTISLATALPTLSQPVTITGPGANLLTVQATTQGAFTIFAVDHGVSATISGLTISNGLRGIENYGTLTATGCIVSGNTTYGISNTLSGTVTASNCTVSGNTNFGIYNQGALTASNCTVSGSGNSGIFNTAGTVTATNCTVSGNNNVGISNAPGNTVTATNCTLSGNFYGIVTGGTATLKNTLVAGNSINVSGGFTDGGNNITTGMAADAGLDPAGLQDNGGPTKTIKLVTGSPAIDAGDTTLTADQRGSKRPIDGDGNGTAIPDIGAYEFDRSQSGTPSFVVNTVSDHDDSVCGATDCTLREAVNTANTDGVTSTITFSSLFNSAQIIDLLSSGLTLSADVTIIGPGANLLTVREADASQSFDIFTVDFGVSATLSGLTLNNGSNGLYNNGTATVTGCALSGNTNGLVNAGTANVTNSTLSSNGKGIYNVSALTLLNSTLSGNVDGIYSQGGVTLLNSTLSGNTSSGLSNNGGTATLSNSIIAGNSTTDFAGNACISVGYNLVGKAGTSGFVNGQNGDKVGTNVIPINAKLGPLANNGGPTKTHALLIGSPAINAGDPAYSGPLTTDQRETGFPRVQGGRLDIGAFEATALQIDDVTVTEGDSGTTSATFTVNLSSASTQTITVSYGAIAGTTNPATVGSDFLSTKGTLTFAPGDTTKTITVPVVGDYVSEADETFIVKLSSPVNVTIGDGQGLGTITNDDFDTTPPTVSFTTSTTTATGTTPQTGGTVYNVVPAITGVAADAGSGIARVQLRLYRLTATAGVYEYWNGTGWVIPSGTVAIPLLSTTLSGAAGSANVSWSRSTAWPTGSNFADGTYYLNAYAYDRVGKFASSSRNFKKLTDNTAPSVSFTTGATTPVGTTPVSGSTVINTMPTITGVAADSASGVAKVELRLYRPTSTAGVYENWTGSTWTGTLAALSTTLNPAAGGASISWSKSSGWPSGGDFADGTYYLRATAYDKVGNLTATLASNFKKVTSAGQALQLFENDEPSQ